VSIPSNRSLRRDIETIFHSGTLAGLSDGQLLERFAAGRGGVAEGPEAESAFAILIERHGAMVLRVCRAVLGDPHDAEDAFQATFLTLIRRAGAIRKRESVGPWLHGVAHRVSLCARSAAARRRLHERRSSEARNREGSPMGTDTGDLDLPETIHAELARLPERYRAPIVLCDLGDRSLDEAARHLGWPTGTIKSRLNRGRQRLRDRLVRRGVAPAIAGAALSSGSADAAIAVPPELARTTAGLMAGAGAPSAGVLALIQSVGRATIMTRMKLAGAAAIVTGMSAVGIGSLAGVLRPGDGPGAPSPQGPAIAGPAEPAPTKKAPRRPAGDDSRIETISVAGRAVDPSGRPVAGAMIYVVDANRRRAFGADDVLAKATTDRDGRYIARDVELPVWKPAPGPIPAPDEGLFQVAGTAVGFGFTWHPTARFRPGREEAPAAGEPDVFHRGEPISVDLSFGPPAVLRGKVTDDRGRPLANARVQVGLVDDGRREGGKTWRCRRVDPTGSAPDDRLEFDGIHVLPEGMLSTRTGPDGGYRIDGLPRETVFLARIDPGPEFDASMETIATTAGPVKDARALGPDAVLDARLEAPREARVKVILGDTQQPARDVTVRARDKDQRMMIRAGGVAMTDADGWATLRLRAGIYDLAFEPAAGMPYLPGRGRIPVTGDVESREYAGFRLEPAAIVTMEARDAKTDEPIEGVAFRYETDSDSRPRELQSQPVIVDRPATDALGRLVAVLEPGRKRFLVGDVPPGWKYEGRASQPTILVAGREVTYRWMFAKLEVPRPGSGEPLFPDDLVTTWERQDRRALPGRFRVRHYFYWIDKAPTPDELEAFLDANDLGKLADPAGAIEARFPTAQGGVPAVIEILDDGRRRRNTVRYQSPGGGTETVVANGRESVSFGTANGQADISGPGSRVGHQVFGWRDICARPWPLESPHGRNRARGRVRREESGGRLTVEETIDQFVVRSVVDRQTGFVLAESRRSEPGMASGEIVRQYGPKAGPDGVMVPTVHLLARLRGPGLMSIDLDIIDEVHRADRPGPADFAIAAPAGTTIVDYRQAGDRPVVGSCHYPVADVIAYADGRTTRPSIEPTLKVGDPAPAIEPAAWLDRDDEKGPPDVSGRVVLVDFWGISCGPCVSELPEVQKAAAYFAEKGKDLVIIGLHEGGAGAEEVADFARKRGLNYRLAVDRPADEDGWFGATFRAYGIRGIPAAAVIDRKGRVAFVGRFPQALERAAQLAAP
jgi:RNA polymerase sigma factor (sigma-70 family)